MSLKFVGFGIIAIAKKACWIRQILDLTACMKIITHVVHLCARCAGLHCIALHHTVGGCLLCHSTTRDPTNKICDNKRKECTFCAPFVHLVRVLKSSQVQKTYLLLKDKPHFSITQTYMCNTQVAMGPWMKTTTPPPSSFCSATTTTTTTTTTNAHGQLLHTSLL